MFEQRRDVVLKAELDKVHRIMISCNSIISTETKRTFCTNNNVEEAKNYKWHYYMEMLEKSLKWEKLNGGNFLDSF